jgi:molecular chaperone HtpG
VLLLTDRVDEWMLSFLNEFDGKPLQSVARGDLDLGALNDEEKQAQEKVGEELKPLVESMKAALEGKVKDVRLTFRLTDSPTCLVADDGEMSGYLQRMLKQAGQAAPQMQPILEVNPEHPLVKQLHADDAHFSDWCHLLFDQAMLAEGGSLEDPASFVKRTNTLLLAR